MSPGRIIEHTRDIARRYGTAAAMRELVCRAANKLVDLRILRAMVVCLSDVGDASLFDAQGLNARFASDAELATYAAAGAYELSDAFLRDARARGDRCYALFDGKALAAYGWYARRPTPIDDHYVLHFDTSHTYMYKGYTVQAYRGRRLHAIGMCRALRAFSEEGSAGLVSWVDANNFSSLQSVARMGYRIFGDVYLLRAGELALATATQGCRDYGFRVERLGAGVRDQIALT